MRIKQNNMITGCLCALGCEVLFGFSYVFTKHTTETSSELSLMGWRYLVAFIVMTALVITGVLKVNLKGKNLNSVLLIALFCPVIYYLGETIGISHTTASESGIVLACIPVASLIASSLILKEKPSKLQISGIGITLTGVLITVIALGASANVSIVGYVALTIAVVSYSLYSVFVEKSTEFTGIEITYIMLTAGAVVFVVLAFAEALINGNVKELIMLPQQNKSFLIAVIYQGLGCSVLAYFLSNIAISKIGVNRTASFIGISTAVSIIAGMVILGENVVPMQIMGAIVIIIGVYVANKNLMQ